MSAKQVSFAFLASIATLLAISAIPIVVGTINANATVLGIPIFIDSTVLGSSNVERLKSMADGLNLFLSHPIFGAGLGVYFSEQLRLGTALVIHSTPIWLLAEGGIVGLAAFAIPGALILMNAWRGRQNDMAAQSVILTLVAFSVMSSVHELLYQRALWLILGVGLALSADASQEDQIDVGVAPHLADAAATPHAS